MLKEKVQQALNKQLNEELFSSYIYLSMAAYFEANHYSGFANWMRKQADEEHEHSLKFFDYINHAGGRVKLMALGEPQFEWKSPLEVFENALEHEIKITNYVNDLVNLAIAEKDHATNQFLQWFVSEQVEEVATADSIVNKLKMIGNSSGALYMLDRELGKRS